MTELGPVEIDLLRAAITERSGLAVPEERVDELRALGRARARASGAPSAACWVARLRADPDLCERETDRLCVAMAVNETYFFRDRVQLDAAVEHAARAGAKGRARPARVLSAGASTGAEAYSVAILARERRPEIPGALDIVGVDLSRAAIDAARRGRYPEWALRQTPREIRERYFDVRGGVAELCPSVRAEVSFAVENLIAPSDGLWVKDAFDVILFRNVLMYLTREASEIAALRMARALAPGGVLFLGHTESLRGLSTSLELTRERGVAHYRHAVPVAPVAILATRRPERPRAERPCAPSPSRASPLEAAIHLVEHGDLSRAEEACARAAGGDDLDAATHYLHALCRDRAGDLAGAIRHDTAAAFLDPTFAMPCLHLGLMERRAGDERAARRELARAEALLAREDEARIDRFGGGLDRPALLRICHAMLAGEEAA